MDVKLKLVFIDKALVSLEGKYDMLVIVEGFMTTEIKGTIKNYKQSNTSYFSNF